MKGIQNTSTENFSSIIGNNKKFIVPKFQRDYSWSSEQWDDLWQDIETMVADDDEHYMGYLVLQTDDDKTYHIIDGQQRFTTITILILAAIKCIQRLGQKGIDPEDNRQRVDNLLCTYIGKKNPVTLTYDNILVLNRNNDGYYRNYIVKLEDLKVRNLKISEKLMKRCFDFFEQKLSNKYTSGQEYAQFIQIVVERLYFTQIVVNDEMNAFRVFETLNARGVQLSSADLLKNYLFSLVDKHDGHESFVDILEEKWGNLTNNIKTEKLPEFLRYYWNSKHKSIRANALFKTIKKNITEAKQVFSTVDDLYRYSDIYMALTDANDEFWEDREIRRYVGLLNIFGLKQPYPLLMSAYMNLDANEFKNLFKYVIRLCFRYNVICDRNPNDQEQPFNSLAIKISNEGEVDYSLLSPLRIEDKAFEDSFSDKAFPYTSRNVKIIRYILSELEHYDGLGFVVDYLDEDATIEHILPQNISEGWDIEETKAVQFVPRLGNMCLLERKKNTDIKNNSFEDKKLLYSTSCYINTRNIADSYTHWDDSTICDRQRKMARKAKTIWRI